jgi:hypothetical protein
VPGSAIIRFAAMRPVGMTIGDGPRVGVEKDQMRLIHRNAREERLRQRLIPGVGRHLQPAGNGHRADRVALHADAAREPGRGSLAVVDFPAADSPEITYSAAPVLSVLRR